MTKLGRAWVYDVNAFQCSDWLKDDDVSNHGSWSSAHDHMVTPSGSTSSHDMVTPPGTHFSSSENSSRLVNAVYDLWCCYSITFILANSNKRLLCINLGVDQGIDLGVDQGIDIKA